MALRRETAWVGMWVLAGCATVAPRRAVPVSNAVGELAMAQPAATLRDDRGVTGIPTRVVLGGRRARAAEIFHEFLRRLVAHDASGVAAMCAPVVTVMADAQEVPSSALSTQLDLLASGIDPSAVDALFTSTPPTVRSRTELRHSQTPPAMMEDGDFFVEISVTAVTPRLPRSLLLRWTGDDARVVALSRPTHHP